ncbi:MAG: L,D-transpeptidase family protein [Chthoniobacteraceae bacterium]
MKKLVLMLGGIALVGTLAWANWPERCLSKELVANRVVVDKSDGTLTLFRGDKVLKSYSVALGRGAAGAKAREGDNETPEGNYRIVAHVRDSQFHRALRVSYPNASDEAHARQLGLEPGSDIMIHGIKNGLGWVGRMQRWVNWTAGCVAVTDPEIEQIYAAVPDGTVVEIRK